MRRSTEVYLDTIHDSLQGMGLTNDKIMKILRSRVLKLKDPPTRKQLNDYFEAKGLKQ